MAVNGVMRYKMNSTGIVLSLKLDFSVIWSIRGVEKNVNTQVVRFKVEDCWEKREYGSF